MTDPLISRRSLLRGTMVVAAAGVAGYVVAANSSAAKGGTGTNPYGSSTPDTGRLLARLSQIPVGGGIVLSGAKVVLSRSPSGAVHGLSAICTHQGCTVDAPHNGVIACPCHGSRFNAETGAVINGPATEALPPVAVAVRSGAVYRS